MKLNRIKNGIELSLNYENSIYIKDFSLSMIFIQQREFEKLQELIHSIIVKENRKDKKDRISTINVLKKTKEFIDDYAAQFEV